MNRQLKVQKKIEQTVVSGYKAIENGVVSGYRSMESGVVGAYKKVEKRFVDTFLTPEGDAVVEPPPAGEGTETV